jgi:hypothetical protein
MKPGVIKRLDLPDVRVIVAASTHACKRLGERGLQEKKILQMVDDALGESVEALHGHVTVSPDPMNMVVRSRGGGETVILVLSLRKHGFRAKDGSLTDVVNVVLRSVHGRRDFVAQSPKDYEMTVNGKRVELLFHPSTERQLRDAVAMSMREMLADMDLEEWGAYHLESELVDYWAEPIPGGKIEIEGPRWKRETYGIEVP